MKRLQRGLGLITAIIILVILAALASAMTTFGTTQHLTSAQDVMAVRAWQAAKVGNEWGLYMALLPGGAGTGWDSGAACTPHATIIGTAGTTQTKTINLVSDLGFSVAVTCSATRFNEGEDPASTSTPKGPLTITLYTISSIATNGTSVISPGYVERRRVIIANN